MKAKCKIIKRVYGNGNYQILGAIPLERCEVILNNYNNFSIKDPTLLLNEGDEYEIEFEVGSYNGQPQYIVKSIPSLALEDVNSLNKEKEFEILKQITTLSQAEYVNEAYPNFIRLVLNGEEDKIDVNKIYNVGETRFNIYKRLVNEKYKYYQIISSFREYKLTMQECKTLCAKYGTTGAVHDKLNSSPYTCLIDDCERSFGRVDSIILKLHPEFQHSPERIEHLMLDVLNENELDGNTYMDANEMAEYINSYDSSVIKELKPVAQSGTLIYYDDATKRIAKMSTYLAEVRMCDFIKHKLTQNNPYNIDWTKYLKTDNFTLTETQAKVLENICKYNISILLGHSGTGKSSSMQAVVNMLEDNNISYTLLAPTGKAASRLSETTKRPASTMHRYILSNGGIDSSVLIVDEFSFFGTEWGNMLINGILNEDMHILFVGDNAQLNPIQCGKVFQDLIDSEIIPITYLTEVFRYAEGGIDKVATDIRQGKIYTDSTKDTTHIGKDYILIQTKKPKEALIKQYTNLINNGVSPQDITCITPYNIGKLGCYTLNNEIQSIINPILDKEPKMCYNISRKGKTYELSFHKGDYVMNIKNDYNAITYDAYLSMTNTEGATEEDIVSDVQVFNGDCGKVVKCTDKFLVVNFDNQLVVYTNKKIEQLIHAMVITTHRMQGSQNKYIINITAPEHKNMLTRNLLYVANTRAQIQHIEIGSIDTIMQALSIQENKQRQTMLCSLLKE